MIRDLPASQAVFAADWRSITLAPLDSCGIVRLADERYQMLRRGSDPALAAVMENYRIWRCVGTDFEVRSSVLYDTVAVHLAHGTDFLDMADMNILIDEHGFTRPDPRGRPMRVAIGWRDLPGYLDALTRRMLSPAV